MNLRKLSKMTFEQGNTCVVGLRGCGKDMLFANIIARQDKPYISNTDYKIKDKRFKRSHAVYIPLDLTKICLPDDYDNFTSGDIIPYDYPYPENCDIYIADCGVYLPSQYCNELNKKYKGLTVFQALSRHLGQTNVHFNVQNLNRVWDKFREQSDTYVLCRSCRVLGKVVFQKITVYDKYESCVQRVKPFKPLKAPLLAHGESRAIYQSKNQELKRNFEQNYGSVKNYLLIYKNRSNYDTRLFKTLLGGCK